MNTTLTEAVNPRFVAYAQAHGRTTAEQIAHDDAEYPDGKMTSFICWLSKQLCAFKREHPEHMRGCFIGNQEAFTQYLQERANIL